MLISSNTTSTAIATSVTTFALRKAGHHKLRHPFPQFGVPFLQRDLISDGQPSRSASSSRLTIVAVA